MILEKKGNSTKQSRQQKETESVVRAPTMCWGRSGPVCCGLFGHFPSIPPLTLFLFSVCVPIVALIDAGHFNSFTMQSRRTGGLTPLAIVLPHPPLPHRRSSLLSLNSAASPHTPRSCASPSLFYPANRKSTDSWNSSNADDMDFEWKPEQVLLLSRVCLRIFFYDFPSSYFI